MRALSLVFDIMFLSSLGILIPAVDELSVLPIALILIGIIVQAVLLRRFKLCQQRLMTEMKICKNCERTISAGANICRFCLTETDERPGATQVSSQESISDLELQKERWLAANAENSL